MKTFSASDLGSHKRTEVFEAAKEGGVIIQKRGTNGKPLDEFVMLPLNNYKLLEDFCTNNLEEYLKS